MIKKEMSTTLTPKQRAFLAAYAESGNVSKASRDAGVQKSTHYQWKSNPVYMEAFEAAHEIACDALEWEARRRAIDGVLKPVYHRGKVVGEVVEYSDALLMFLLRAERRQKFNPSKDAAGEGTLLVALPKAVIGVDMDKV